MTVIDTKLHHINTYIMGSKNSFGKNMNPLHKDKDGWGTDPEDGKVIGDILRGIGDMVATILGAKKK